MNISQKISKRIFLYTHLIIIALVLTSNITAQTTVVDPTFNPVLSKDKNQSNNSIQSNFTLQPDGKILTYGGFQVINGVIKNGIARLNADGSLDNSFNCTACNFSVISAATQPDGKIIVGGFFSVADGSITAARIRRLNADGTLDASFNPTSPFNDNPAFPNSYSAAVNSIQPDGKILVLLSGSSSGQTFGSLQRLNADGTSDPAFTPIQVIGGRLVQTSPRKILLQSDGKILIAINNISLNTSASFTRYNADGTTDSTFEAPSFSGSNGGSYSISDFDVRADGSIFIVGNFYTVNAVSRVNIVKLLPAGNVDLTFAPTNIFQSYETASGVELFSNGNILVSTSLVTGPGAPTGTTNRFIRYNPNGDADTTFPSPANLFVINKFVIDSSDRVFISGVFLENGMLTDKYARLNADGSVAALFAVNYGIGGSVTTLTVQTDNKIIVAGSFTQISGISRSRVARINPDGSVDQTFNAQLGERDSITKAAVQPDGKILLGGAFSINNTFGFGLIRLNADGSSDATFSTAAASVGAIVPLPNGKILIGGSFYNANGQTSSGVFRLNPDGTFDTGFNVLFSNSAVIRSVISQADGKIIVGGAFSGVSGFNRTNLVRLNADGALDTTFNAGNIAAVSAVELYPNGKYIVSAGSLEKTVVRVNADGTTDLTFQSPSFSPTINAISVQPDGTIIIGGDFTPTRILRLRANGTVDTTTFPAGTNDVVRVIVRQADGQILVGGDFTLIANVVRFGIARLTLGAVRAPFTPFDFDGDGRADIAVFRPSNGVWYQLRSQNNAFNAFQFGQSGDLPAPADFDGDGKADLAVFRDNLPGGNAAFFITNSSDNSFRPVQFGLTGDVPVVGDWDGDGIADLAVYRSASVAGGQSYFIYRASSIPNAGFTVIPWGTLGDKPVMGDFDGDGKLDAAVYRPSSGAWYVIQSSNKEILQALFGVATDIPVPADYDGDGKANLAVYRPSNGTWYIARPTGTPAQNFDAVQFGTAGDLPVAADYDGDGKADVAVFRPSNGSWYLNRSTAGFTGVQFGTSEDHPIPNAFVR